MTNRSTVAAGARRRRLQRPRDGRRNQRGSDHAQGEAPAGQTRAAGRRGRRLRRLVGFAAGLGQPAQLALQIAHRLPAVAGVLGETGPHQPVEPARQARPDLAQRGRLVLQDRSDDARLAVAVEGPPAGQHLVQHGPEGEDVRASVDRLPVELLGRHVLQGAEQAALRRQRGAGRRRRRVVVRGARVAQPGQSEVEQLHAGGREHHVARLQVAVDDAPPVGGIERLGNVAGDVQRLVQGQRPPLKAPGQRLPVEALHDEEVDRRLRLVGRRRAARRPLAADVVQSADVRVAEPPHGPRLALEALARGGVGGHVRGQDLDGDRAVEARVGRPVHLAHAARPEGADHLVGPEPHAWSQCHAQDVSCRRTPGRRLESSLSRPEGPPWSALDGGETRIFAVRAGVGARVERCRALEAWQGRSMVRGQAAAPRERAPQRNRNARIARQGDGDSPPPETRSP